MDKPLLALAIAMASLSAPLAAQTQKSAADRAAAKQQQIDRAKERCRANRGVDCETPEGLKEWVLQERTRQEAIRDGSHRRAPQSRPAPQKP